MRYEDYIPQAKPVCEMRNTTLPPHMAKDAEQQNVNWNH